MAPPKEPASDAPSAPDPDAFDVNDIFPELAGTLDSLYWDSGDWTVSRADDVALFSILASGSGLVWQRRVREAQQRGETLPLKDDHRARDRSR